MPRTATVSLPTPQPHSPAQPLAAGLLTDKVVVVTGAFGVLGTATAAAVRAAGGRTVMIDRTSPTPSLASGPTDLILAGVELANFAETERAFAQVGTVFRRIDALLNIAGAFEWQTVAKADRPLWDYLYQANVLTTASACRAALPLMQADSAIVNVAAAAASRAAAGMGPYAAAKAGVLRLTEALAEELKPRGIRVNAVSPTILDTPRNRADMPDADPTSWMRPEDLAQVLVFLASPGAHALNGANVLTGG